MTASARRRAFARSSDAVELTGPGGAPDDALARHRAAMLTGYRRAMTSFEELDALSSEELHDRAFRHARRHMNVRFFWDLMQYTPAAEAETGDIDQGESDIAHVSGQVIDAIDDEPELRDAMRPVYIDYLLQHPGA